MEILLIGGSRNTGKSTFIYRAAYRLHAANYSAIPAFLHIGPLPTLLPPLRLWADLSIPDGCWLFTKVAPDGSKKNVLVNMATDDQACIDRLIQRIKAIEATEKIDVLITSIRSHFDGMRDLLIKELKLNQDNFPLEIALATRHGSAGINEWLDWYFPTTDRLITHTLANNPYLIP